MNSRSAHARFAIKSWDEKPYSEGQDLPKLTKATVVKIFTGDIEGEGRVDYLMMYRSDGSATFIGLERIVGRLSGRTGSFVLQRTGVFEGGQAKESYSVIPGSGTFRSTDNICRSLSSSRDIRWRDIASGVLGFFVRPSTIV